MSNLSADSQRRRSAGQRSIRRRCTCGRVIVGNAAWASHLSVNRGFINDDRQFVPTCGFAGRA